MPYNNSNHIVSGNHQPITPEQIQELRSWYPDHDYYDGYESVATMWHRMLNNIERLTDELKRDESFHFKQTDRLIDEYQAEVDKLQAEIERLHQIIRNIETVLNSQKATPEHGSITASGEQVTIHNPYKRTMILEIIKTWDIYGARTDSLTIERIGPGEKYTIGPQQNMWFTITGVTE
jgi:hypothetical protein